VKTYPHQQLQTDLAHISRFLVASWGTRRTTSGTCQKCKRKKKTKNPEKEKESPPPLNTNHRAPGPWCTELSRPYPCGGARVGLYISHQRPGCPHPRIAPARSAFSSPASDLPLAALTAALLASSPPSPRARHLASSLHVARARLYKVRLPPLFRPLRSRLRKGLEFGEPS
jgi:hypothetical protein